MKRIVTLGVAFGLLLALANGAEAQTFTKRRWKKSDPRPQMVEETTPEGALVLTLARAPFPMPQTPDQVGSAPEAEPGDASGEATKPAAQSKPANTAVSKASSEKQTSAKKTSSKSAKPATKSSSRTSKNASKGKTAAK